MQRFISKKIDYFGIRQCFLWQKSLIIVRHGDTLTAQDVSPNLKSSKKCSFLSLQIVCIWHLTKQYILLPPKNWSGKSPWSIGEYSTKVKRESAKFAVRQPLSETLIVYTGCVLWIHKKCSGIHGSLKPDPSFKRNRCLGKARPIDGTPLDSLTVDGHQLAVVESFCYLRECISSGGGCETATVNRIRAAWGKFREL